MSGNGSLESLLGRARQVPGTDGPTEHVDRVRVARGDGHNSARRVPVGGGGDRDGRAEHGLVEPLRRVENDLLGGGAVVVRKASDDGLPSAGARRISQGAVVVE